MSLQVIDISEGTTVDGPGLRTSIYFAGCTHQCLGCQNPQTWDPEAGHDMTIEEIIEVVRFNDFNVTFSGGDPLFQVVRLTPLAKYIKEEMGKTIWCYTGYLWEAIAHREPYRTFLQYVDVLVDGPFILAQRDISLLFRGSANQRLIDVQKSYAAGKVVIAEP